MAKEHLQILIWKIADKFNDHFTTIAAKIEKKLVKSKKNFHEYLIYKSKQQNIHPLPHQSNRNRRLHKKSQHKKSSRSFQYSKSYPKGI